MRLRVILITLLAAAGFGVPAHALETVHFLIPGGAGGGWDTTARVVGRVLQQSGLLDTVSFENMSGASGGKGVSHLVETAEQNRHVLMINSTPIIQRSLIPVYRQSWRDLTPVAAVIGDYGALTVRQDSRFESFADVLAELRKDPRSLTFAGGSTRGGLDHLIIASVYREAGLKPMDARYVPYDAGGKALYALLSGETDVLSATVGDAVGAVRDGRVRILAITATERLAELPEVPTFIELGYAVELLNWRGFFAAPGVSDEQRDNFVELLSAMRGEEMWRRQVARNGWIEKFVAGDDFVRYLEQQETFIGGLMAELGFIEARK